MEGKVKMRTEEMNDTYKHIFAVLQVWQAQIRSFLPIREALGRQLAALE